MTMAYDFTQLPVGQSESRLELWRYDPDALQWTLVPSHDDPVGHVLTAQTSHFSTFAPFFVAAGANVSSVQVFPQPWEIGERREPVLGERPDAVRPAPRRPLR